MRQQVSTSSRKVHTDLHLHMIATVQLEEEGGGRRKQRWRRKAPSGFPPSCLHTCSLNWKELVLHLPGSPSSMVRSVKVTLPSASIRMIVLVLNGRGPRGHKQTNKRHLKNEKKTPRERRAKGRSNTVDHYEE